MKTIVVVLCLFLLSGCAALQEKFATRGKPIGQNATVILLGITPADSTAISQDMAEYLASQLPPAKTTIGMDVLKNPLHLKLSDALALRGFGVTTVNADGAVWIRYYVTDLDRGLLVRLRYGNTVASRFYDRAHDGSLSLYSPFTVREARK